MDTLNDNDISLFAQQRHTLAALLCSKVKARNVDTLAAYQLAKVLFKQRDIKPLRAFKVYLAVLAACVLVHMHRQEIIVH